MPVAQLKIVCKESIVDYSWKVEHKTLISNFKFKNERELQLWLAHYLLYGEKTVQCKEWLESDIKFINNKKIELEKTIELGRADIVVNRYDLRHWGKGNSYVIECKAVLTIPNIAQALGQLWLYKRYFPGYIPVIAGGVDGELKFDSIHQRLKEANVCLWKIKTLTKKAAT